MLPDHFSQRISLPVASKPGAPGILQLASFERLLIVRDKKTGAYSVEIGVETECYADENGSYGVKLTGTGIAPWPVTLHGNNESAVDPQTGEVLLNQTDEETPAQFRARCEADPRPLKLQGDWLETLMFSGPVDIPAMIRMNMEAANRPPYDKFAR